MIQRTGAAMTFGWKWLPGLLVTGLCACGSGSSSPERTFTLGGTVAGLAGSGLVLATPGQEPLPVEPGRATFTFAARVPAGTAYAVTVASQPAGPAQVCSVQQGAGVVGEADVTTVIVTCVTTPPPPYRIGGTVSGLTGRGLVLATPGQADLPIAPGQTTFAFAQAVEPGTAYAVTVEAQPADPAQHCEVTAGEGAVGAADVTGIAVTCEDLPTRRLGGTIAGLLGSGLVLGSPGLSPVVPSPGATEFVLAEALAEGTAYDVTVLVQPIRPPQHCTVGGGAGTVGATDVSSVAIACVTLPTYALGGTIAGLAGSGLLLATAGQPNLAIAPGQTTFTFPYEVVDGTPYAVSVVVQPYDPRQTCTVAGGTGAVAAADVTGIALSCTDAPLFRLRGTLAGYDGSGLVLRAGGQPELVVPPGATEFVFELPVEDGARYAGWVGAQPTDPPQLCDFATANAAVLPLVVAGADAVAEVTCSTGARPVQFEEGPRTLAYLVSAPNRIWADCTATGFAASDAADAPVYALTAGHCPSSELPTSDEVYLDAVPSYLQDLRVRFDVYADGPSLQVGVARIAYATMWNHDVAILELDRTRAALEAAGMSLPRLADLALEPGPVTTYGISQQDVTARRTDCTLRGAAWVLEHVWSWPVALSNACDLDYIKPGSSGSPLFARGDTTRIAAVLGTASQVAPASPCALDAPCELQAGLVVNVPGSAYWHDVSRLARCFGADGRFDRALPACRLPRSTFSLRRLGSVPHGVQVTPNGTAPAGVYRWKVASRATFDPTETAGYGAPVESSTIDFSPPAGDWVLSAVSEEDWDPVALDPLAVHVIFGRD